VCAGQSSGKSVHTGSPDKRSDHDAGSLSSLVFCHDASDARLCSVPRQVFCDLQHLKPFSRVEFIVL
jgi:hypothetical protein